MEDDTKKIVFSKSALEGVAELIEGLPKEGKLEGVVHHQTPMAPKDAKPGEERPFVFFLTTVGWDREKEQSRSRCVGWFPTFEEAEEYVVGNYGDLEEAGYYKWAVIEKMESGLYPHHYIDENKWFQFEKRDKTQEEWDPNAVTAVRIECPEQFKSTCGWGLG